MSAQMVFATMGDCNLEASVIDSKIINRVVSFFSFRKCKCVPEPHITRPLISTAPPKDQWQCQAGAPCLYNTQCVTNGVSMPFLS